MIVLIVGELGRGPAPLALEGAGFEARGTDSVQAAEWDVQNEGEDGCVLVLDAAALEGAADGDWGSFLERHPALPVVVLRGGDEARARLGRRAHRLVLAEVFDAAAVVAAVRRVVAKAPTPARPDEDLAKLGSGGDAQPNP